MRAEVRRCVPVTLTSQVLVHIWRSVIVVLVWASNHAPGMLGCESERGGQETYLRY